MKRALLALILALPLALSAQFRIVGTGLFTTLNDSTYRAKIDFRPDLTGNSYNATQLNDSMLVLSQKGQLYRLDSFYNASFSSAFIIVVEKNGNWGSPVGQIMVFQNNSSLAAPQAVYGANGATAGMQAGVDTWNALLLKVVSDSAVYWNQAYSNSIDSLNVSGDSLKTITLYRASGDSISATFVDGGGSGPVTDTLYGEVKGPLDSTYIDTVANIIFKLDSTAVGVGELKYNDTQGSIQQGLKGGNVTNVIGQQLHQRVLNKTGSPLAKGEAVYLQGSQGNRITVAKAIATIDSTSANTFGIVAESIANNQSGYIITEGLITGLNTNSLTEGMAVYLSPTVAGGLTTTKPQAPDHGVYIGVCVKQNNGSGELFVKIRNGQELDELHDVRITSPDSSASLYYNTSESVWRDTTAAVLTSDTSVFARDFQINGTANYLAKFTGSNAVGNSVAFNTGRNLYFNSTQGNTSNALTNSFEFNGYGSAALDQPFIAVVGNVGSNANHRPRLAMYRTAGDTVNSRALVPYNYYLGSLQWNAADGVDMISTGAEITAITDSITGENDMPTALTFGTTANGQQFPTERMRITSAGNVGINTTTPAYRLDVNGDVNTTGMYKKSGTDIISGTTNYLAKFTGANTIGNSGFIENGQEVYLGGTTDAFNDSRFSIYYNPVNNGFPIVADTRAYNAGPLPGAGWNFGGKKDSTGAYTAFGAIQGAKETSANSEAGYLQFSTNSDGGSAFPEERMRITSAGNVGLNTTTPAYRLDVNGDVNTTGMYKKSGTDIISGTTNRLAMFTGSNTVGNSVVDVTSDTVSIRDYSNSYTTWRFHSNINKRGFIGYPSGTRFYSLVNPSSYAGFMYGDRSAGAQDQQAFTQLTAYNGGGATSGFFSAATTLNGADSTLYFNISGLSANANPTFPAAQMVIQKGGNVGINTTTPTAKLHINNPSSTTPALNIVSNSNVIGSTNDAVSINMQPGQVNQNNTGVRVFNTITGTSAEGNNTGIAVSLNARNSSYGVYSAVSKNWGGSSLFGEAIGVYGSATTDSPAGFSYGGYFKNDTTQGTGFGVFVQTTTPKGSGTVTPLAIQHNSTELMRVQSSGNVGIATSSPSRPLHVAGTTAIRIPVGTTSDRGTSANGDIRYNTTNANFEWYSGTGWREPVNAARSPAAGLANRFSKFNADGLLDTSAILIQANNRIGIFNSPAAGDSALTVTGSGNFTTGLRVGGRVRVGGSQTFSDTSRYQLDVIGTGRFTTQTISPTIVGGIANNNNLTFRATLGTSSDFNNLFRFRGGLAASPNTVMEIGYYNSGGTVGIPTVTNYSYALNVNGGIITDDILAKNTGPAKPQSNFWNASNDQTASYFNFQKSRGAAATAIVQDGDEVGNFGFGASNGNTGFYSQAQIKGIVSGPPVNLGIVPVDFIFYTSETTTNAIPNLIERMRITYNGKIGVNTNAPKSGLDVRTSFGRGAPVTITSATYTVDSLTNWIICNRTGTITLTLPTASSWTGREIMIKTIEAQTVVSATSNVVPLAGGAATTAILPATDGAWCTLVSDGTNWIIMQRGS